MALSIYFDESQKTIFGETSPSDDASGDDTENPVTPGFIKQRLEAIGFPDLSLDPQGVNRLCMAAQRGEAEKVALKILVDGSFDIQVSGDKKSATLTLVPADGGKDITLEDIKEGLLEHKIVKERVDWEAIIAALEQKQVNNLCIASAQMPVPGVDAVYTPLVESEVDNAPVVDENGVADMLSGHSFTLVEPGAQLMRRQPATPGEPGMDVTGQEIKPIPGKDPGFASNIEGAEIAADDPNLLIASIKGHPIIYPTGVSVDPVLHVNNVDVHTGNINFDGSLEVKGDVTAGMHINVSGDVIVKGVVERDVEIQAGNNLVVRGGIFGDEAFKEQQEIHYTIQAQGSIEAAFMSLVAAKAGKDIIVKQYIGNCIVAAGDKLLLGQNGGKGILFGGIARAKNYAAVAQLGNETYIETKLIAGELEELLGQIQQLEATQLARQKEVDQLTQIYKKLQQQDPVILGKISVDKATRIKNTIAAIKEKISAIEIQLASLHKAMESQKTVKVVVTKLCYPNTTLVIHGVEKNFKAETRGETWIQVANQIIAEGDKE